MVYEIYLFFKRGVIYTPLQLYNKLSNNDTATITKKSLIDFLTNSHRGSLKHECELIIRANKEDLKDFYTYNDIVELFYEIKKEDVDKKFRTFLRELNLAVYHAEIFYTKPDGNLFIHIDTETLSNN